MPDISMCFGKDCDRRENCYRYKAKPNQVQTYSDLEQDCRNHNYRNQWEMNENQVYVDHMSNMLTRC